MSRSQPLAITARTIFFGLCHACYGIANMGAVTLLGLALGLLAYWRKSPGMLAQGLVDSVGGIVAFSGVRKSLVRHLDDVKTKTLSRNR